MKDYSSLAKLGRSADQEPLLLYLKLISETYNKILEEIKRVKRVKREEGNKNPDNNIHELY